MTETDADLIHDLGYIQHWNHAKTHARDELERRLAQLRADLTRVARERDDAETCLEDWNKFYDMTISPESVAFGKDVTERRYTIIDRRRKRLAQSHTET